MQHAVPPGLVEPAVRPVPFALLARSKFEDADGSGDGHSVPPRGAPADSTHSKAVGADLPRPPALTPATVWERFLVANRAPDWQHEDVGASEQGNGGDAAQSSLRGKLDGVFRGLATAGDGEVAGADVVGARAEAAGGQAGGDLGMSVSWADEVRER
jgi:hypothetical protein